MQPVTVVSDTVDQDGNYLVQASVLEPYCILCYLPCLTSSELQNNTECIVLCKFNNKLYYSEIILAVFLVVVLGTAVTLITFTGE